MKIKVPGRRSEHLRDLRGQGGGAAGGVGGMSLPAGKLGLPMLLILLVVGAVLGGRSIFGGGGDSGFSFNNPFESLQAPAAGQAEDPIPPELDPDADLVNFFSFVFDDVQFFWADYFAKSGGNQYAYATLALFEQSVNTQCGGATDAVGPFYCPADQTVYFDLDFMKDLGERFDAPGDFAQAYVVAHEVGHHVQNLTGINAEVNRLQQQSPDEANELSVRLELQADCLAGVWGYSTYERGLLESGDLEEGLAAAAAVGDDRLQQQATGQVNPETFTHGSSDQRVSWFKRGFESGDPSQCDTFSGGY
jgi:predicted metalloprotease